MKKLIACMLIMMLSFTCLPAWAEDVKQGHPWKEVFSLSAKDEQVEPLALWLSGLAPRPDDVLVTSARQARLMGSRRCSVRSDRCRPNGTDRRRLFE